MAVTKTAAQLAKAFVARQKRQDAKAKELLAGARRADGWVNLLTGVGSTLRDKGEGTDYLLNGLKPDLYYETVFSEDPLAHRVAMLPAEEALREGYKIEGEDEDAHGDDILEYLDDLDANTKFVEAISRARAIGGSVILLGADDGKDPSEPLDYDRIKSLTFLTVLTKRNMFPNSWYKDLFAPRLGEPESYVVTAVPAGGPSTAENTGVTVHESRMLRFDGVVNTPERMQRNNGWGDSIYVQMEEAIAALGMSFKASRLVMQDLSQAVFKIDGLIAALAGTPNGEEAIKRRIGLVDYSRSVARALVIDAEKESFEYHNRQLSGMPELLDRMMYWLSAVTGIPVTLLFGRSPAGMNSTGDADVRFFYDKIKAGIQEAVLRKRLNRLIRAVYRAKKGPTAGVEPGGWSVVFNPLWQMTPEELAKLRKMTAEADTLDIGNGVVTPDEVAISHFGGALYDSNLTIDVSERKKALELSKAMSDPVSSQPTEIPAESLPEAQEVSGVEDSAMSVRSAASLRDWVERATAAQKKKTSRAR